MISHYGSERDGNGGMVVCVEGCECSVCRQFRLGKLKRPDVSSGVALES
jgi:hypothetical protein